MHEIIEAMKQSYCRRKGEDGYWEEWEEIIHFWCEERVVKLNDIGVSIPEARQILGLPKEN